MHTNAYPMYTFCKLFIEIGLLFANSKREVFLMLFKNFTTVDQRNLNVLLIDFKT